MKQTMGFCFLIQTLIVIPAGRHVYIKPNDEIIKDYRESANYVGNTLSR